jgi:hypothetical protein
VSFGSKVIDRRDISIREYQADVVALAFVEEVSVLSPSVQPAEPCAESCRFAPSRRSPQVRRRRLIAPPSASPTTNAAGVGRARAPPRLPSDDANQEQAFVEASRRPIDRYYDEFMAVKRQREPEVIVRHNIGQVLGVR